MATAVPHARRTVKEAHTRALSCESSRFDLPKRNGTKPVATKAEGRFFCRRLCYLSGQPPELAMNTGKFACARIWLVGVRRSSDARLGCKRS
jgi:hypothetical protein